MFEEGRKGEEMFRPVPSKTSFPELEKRILHFWREKRVFERSVAERETSPLFVLYEGPPTANASPGVHHILSRVFKDVIPRYKTMQGYCVPRKAGWDTHGLPVELEIERELGFSSKDEIETYGVSQFNARCRESVFRYQREWEEVTERIGFWLDMEHPYITLDNDYIESCWWVIKQLWEKGLIYQGYKVTPHCPRCGTSLSSHEVALGYEEVDDPSVWIKFKVVPSPISESEGQKRLYELSRDKLTYLLAWTTTPWTLPGNTAIAVAPEAEYVVVKKDDEYLILASACLKQVGLDDCEVVERLKGNDLATIAGVNYEPLYNPHQFGIERRRLEFVNEAGVLGAPRLKLQESKLRLAYKVIAADFVSMEEGTGIVHVAPAFGEIDFEVGMHPDYCLDFVRDYVDLQGVIKGTYPFAGKVGKDADPLILEDLKARGLLYRRETIRHTYPFCWRCATPLLYYAKPSWYIKTTAKKERLIAGNDQINWYPEHIKHGRFGDWLENNVDWACSRERYWGTPLPIWRCEGCGKDDCIGSLEELKNKPGLSAEAMVLKALKEGEVDLHRPYIDEVVFNCSECEGGKMRRLPDVLDAWFDSGAMPVAQWHYPFENKEIFEKFFPADYICEAVDQTRGWFYTLHALSTLLFDRPCFRNVICLGHILDAKGEKMSKSKGNVVDPWAVLDSQGADALRWYLLTSSPAGSVRRFSAELVGEAQRRFIRTLWNTYSFFVTYANIDRFDPSAARDFSELSEKAELDRWIISELHQLIADVTKAMEGYNPTDAGRRIQDFVEDLSNWYVRRSRRRFWKSESDADKLSAYATLYECLVTLAKLLAPLTPFVAEEIYQNLVRSYYPDEPESVHLAHFPIADRSHVDEQLAQDIHLAMKVASLGRAARSKAGIKVRQPLAKLILGPTGPTGPQVRESLGATGPQVLEELNVKEIEFEEDEERLKRLADEGKVEIAEEGGFSVAIVTEITPELADEGMARELVHRLQTMRKQAGFDIADYIYTYYRGGECLKRVIEKHADYVKQETLSRDLISGIPQDAYTESHRIDGEEITLGVKRQG